MKCDGGSHPDESSCCSLTETCDALRLTLEGYSRGQQEKLQHVSDLFSLAEIMGCQRKWMFGWMIVTFTQERSAGLSCSFSSNTLSHTHRKPCEWTCHRCSSVKTSRVWVPPTSWRLAAVSSLSVWVQHWSNFILFICAWVCLCADACTHTLTPDPFKCVSSCCIMRECFLR